MDGVRYSARTRSQCSPQEWDEWSRGAGSSTGSSLARQEAAQQNTVVNEPEALTLPLLESKPTCPTLRRAIRTVCAFLSETT